MQDGHVAGVAEAVRQLDHVQHDPEGAVHAPDNVGELRAAHLVHVEQVEKGLREGEEEDHVEDQKVEHVLHHALDDGHEVAQGWQELDEEQQGPDVEDVGQHVGLGGDH